MRNPGMQCSSLHGGSAPRARPVTSTGPQRCRGSSKRRSKKPHARAHSSQPTPSASFRCCSTAESATSSGPGTEGRDSYQPESFSELIDDACRAIQETIKAGHNRIEVEFPPLSSEGGTSFKSSDSYIDANVQFAIAAAKQLKASGIERVHLLTPEKGEFRRTYGMFKPALETFKETITMGYLQESRKGFFQFLVTDDKDTSVAPPSESAKKADLFIALNATSADLPALEQYAAGPAANKPLILWNLELDTLRSDLGLPGFPGKAVQYRFLSTVKPAFYIRQRDYSKSVPQPPYIVNYSGCLFREFPGPWQVMLKEGNKYTAVADRDERFDLGEVKNELLQAIGLNTEAPGSVFSFLRTGYKTTTWWEDDRDKEESSVWRS